MDAQDSIQSMILNIPSIPPECSVNEAGEMFLSEQFQTLLSLPVVHEGIPIGILSRYELMKIFLKLYGRDLFGKQPVTRIMNPKPLMVDINQSLGAASQYITQNIKAPVTEDFIVVENGQYIGLGIVLDLLRAMEIGLARRTKQLSKAFQDLKSSQAQLVQSEKMASLGQMVAGVAHEINTPLGYVRNNLETASEFFEQSQVVINAYDTVLDLMAADEPDEEALTAEMETLSELGAIFHEEEMTEDIRRIFSDSLYGLDQISELVLNLKDFSRLDQAHVDKVNLNNSLDSVLTIAHNVIKHKVTIHKRYGDIPTIKCSPSQINQVFLNLITNATQAMEGTGDIIIKTSFDDEYVNVVVQDTGKGMPKEVMAKIFDPFYTTKPVGEGTGLGLSISYQIVQKHNGRIKVASQPGKGTRFTVSLPCEASEG